MSLNPERDLDGVSPQLVEQARIWQEHQRQYSICVADCSARQAECYTDATMLRQAGAYSSGTLCVTEQNACAGQCGAYLQ
ncbi:MAG: hypothetical protein ACYCWW_11850 [Deltaproteobacteria bacterium]